MNITSFIGDNMNATSLTDGQAADAWQYWQVYAFIVLAVFIATTPQSMLWRVVFLLGARKCHGRMIRALLRAPMKILNAKTHGRQINSVITHVCFIEVWIDCLGEIANRFSRDLGMVDWVVIFMSYSFVSVSIYTNFVFTCAK